MKTGWKIAILGAVVIGLPLALRVFAAAAAPAFSQSTLTIDSADGPHKFTVEVATTQEQQEYGLMFRKAMPADHGMIFIWPQARVLTMWMKNTILPLDMLFVDGSGKVTHVVANAKPESTEIISSLIPVNAVIELNAGTAQRLGIMMGDTVESPELAAVTGSDSPQ